MNYCCFLLIERSLYHSYFVFLLVQSTKTETSQSIVRLCSRSWWWIRVFWGWYHYNHWRSWSRMAGKIFLSCFCHPVFIPSVWYEYKVFYIRYVFQLNALLFHSPLVKTYFVGKILNCKICSRYSLFNTNTMGIQYSLSTELVVAPLH